MGEFASEHKEDPTPLSVCVAMSQAYIGYDIQNALREEFLNRGGKVPPVVTVVTQVRVDKDDPAFQNPTKPIGRFMTKEEAEAEAQKRGWNIKEDAGRGYRRVVASPKPKEIVELSAIKAMSDAGELVICCGGGGVPVVSEGKHLAGAAAVIDKDFAAALLAESLEADMLIILTAVEKVAIRYGKPDQEWLTDLSVEEAQKYADQGEFAPGSMLPKVQAAIQFASAKKGNEAMITLLEKAREALQGKTGTKITKK
jgi:carbamate kinase